MSHELYLSRLILNPRSRDVQSGLRDCQKLHCLILKAFPKIESADQKAREEFGVLYRIEISSQRNKLSLLVQSRVQPDWSRLPDDFLQADADELNPSCKPVEGIFKEVKEGCHLRFRLRANPTRRLYADRLEKESNPKKRGKRVEIRDQQKQIEWLKRKELDCGFHIKALRLNADVANVQAGQEQKVKGKILHSDNNMTFGSVLFDGELVVTDASKFQQALVNGIGTGKAYGFGLLSFAPSQR
ncbi:MAG: type I-E CRISPR-associated protein Cas6/Cse3/CasE [Acidobacteria bacterium]|nr:type I-E CRISPR-associated protein Cas6/Cse3/CasE [Acidobacteriota bacterium]